MWESVEPVEYKWLSESDVPKMSATKADVTFLLSLKCDPDIGISETDVMENISTTCCV